MYAVIATGGKQYRVAEGDVVRIEKLPAEPGAAVEFDKVLVVGQGADLKVGKPYVAGSKVTGTVQKHGKGEKKREMTDLCDHCVVVWPSCQTPFSLSLSAMR